jgi:predicted aldo/keto reductase-like oxidoreductase
MGGDDIRPEGVDYVLWAMDMGLNWTDTAPHYNNGRSEEGYALVLQARGRENVFMNTKFTPFGPRSRMYRDIFNSLPETEQAQYRNRVAEEIERLSLEDPDYMGNYFTGQAGALRTAIQANLLAEKYSHQLTGKLNLKQEVIDSVEGSLRKLKTDYLDCVLLRSIDTPYEAVNHPELFDGFEALKKAGKVRHLGFSAHNDPGGVLNAAIDSGVYEFGMVAYHYRNAKWLDPVLEKAKKADFGVMAMKASRIIQNPFNRRQTIPDRVQGLQEAVPGDNMTPFQKGFHWALHRPNLTGVVAGITTMEMAKEDIPLALTTA